MIKNGFLIRTRMEGDYLVQDREGHHKKLKKYFIDEKIPASSRGQILLLANGSEIIWAIGERISENYKITKDTEHVVEVTYEKGDIDGR
jgi:tRNA(Ile)-lysidine synthase